MVISLFITRLITALMTSRMMKSTIDTHKRSESYILTMLYVLCNIL